MPNAPKKELPSISSYVEANKLFLDDLIYYVLPLTPDEIKTIQKEIGYQTKIPHVSPSMQRHALKTLIVQLYESLECIHKKLDLLNEKLKLGGEH